MTSERLAELFREYESRGDGYILGLNNELYTQARATKLNKQNRAYYSRGDKWIGRYCSDCSGGIVGAMRTENPDYGDRRADTFAGQFKTGKQPIQTIPETAGVAVWKSGHIGIYVGGNEVVEFRGIDYGCVRTKLKSRPWTHWGYIADVDYPNATLSYPRQMTVKTKVTPLNLRSAPDNGAVIAKMPKNSPVWALAENEGWCECVCLCDGRYYQGFASKEYLA